MDSEDERQRSGGLIYSKIDGGHNEEVTRCRAVTHY